MNLTDTNPRHRWASDRSVIFQADLPAGTMSQEVIWETPELAQEMFPKARRLFLESVAEHLAGKRKPFKAGQRNTTKVLRTPIGAFFVGTMTGPPTWWLPRLKLVRYGITVGWLRLGIHASWKKH